MAGISSKLINEKIALLQTHLQEFKKREIAFMNILKAAMQRKSYFYRDLCHLTLRAS